MKKILVVISQIRDKADAINKIVSLGYNADDVEIFVQDNRNDAKDILDFLTVRDLTEIIEKNDFDTVFLYSFFLQPSTIRDLNNYLIPRKLL